MPSSAADKPSGERPITDVKDLYRHKMEPIYVLGSGPSLDFFPKEFFNRGSGRVMIGCNYVYRKFPVTFTVAKELSEEHVLESAEMGSTPVLSRHAFGNLRYPLKTRAVLNRHYVFGHKTNNHTVIDWSVLGTDELVVSYSTVTSAIHFAAYLGARTIFLCGCDAGTLDGKLYCEGYAGTGEDTKEGTDWYKGFLRDMRGQTLTLRDKLKEAYKCDVLTLSPFVNMGHEGHTFEF